MVKLVSLIAILVISSCKVTTYYISRHAEKADNSANPPLSAEGEKQALDLRDYLMSRNIKAVYATNFVRTRATAQPTAQHFNVITNLYNAAQGNTLVDSLKAANAHNILLIGHSNTVDDLVNRFTGTTTMTDLPDTAYGNLFIVRKKGSSYAFEKLRVPQTTPRLPHP